jgi:hypothetical protein
MSGQSTRALPRGFWKAKRGSGGSNGALSCVVKTRRTGVSNPRLRATCPMKAR